MKRLFSSCFILLWILCPIFVWAQNSRKKVATAAELPRFSYDVPENLTDLLTDNAAYKDFAAKVRADLETVLRDYEIEDKTTLKEIQATLAGLDLQENRLDSAFERYRLARELETKPELKFLPVFFEEEIIAKARKQSGATSGDKFLAALRQVLAETLNSLPDSVFQGVKEYRYSYNLYNDKFFADIVRARLAPKAKKNGNKLFNEDAYLLIGIRTANDFLVPVVGEFAKSFDSYIASHKDAPKINIWTSRAVNLSGNQKLSPIIVAVWDTGVDATVFPNRMFVNQREKADGKDNDRNGFVDDINGINFDVDGKYTMNSLFFVKDDDAKKYAEWSRERRALTRLQDAVDDEETRALKKKFQTATPAENIELSRLFDIFSHYAHGTQVAGIVIEGNPAARILNARSTWRDNSGRNDSVFSNEDWSRRFASNIKALVDYFKEQNARVVNMSWSMSRKDFAENFEKFEPKMDAAERKRRADASYMIVRNALETAIRSAPEILFVCSAGNTDSDTVFNETIPNSLGLPNILAIGAVDERGGAAPFTSFGKNVLLYAQGVNVPSIAPGGEKLMFGGTSATAPETANLAAKLFALNPKLTVAQVIKLIQDGADANEADKRLKLINPKRSVDLLLFRMTQ